ncbi:MAG: PH domain-containing protein [Johnsonella sp.]|nr:PH domain-containing protein [Johnsonella sp.]
MIERMIEQDESVLWSGKPDKLIYSIGSPFFYIFALIWGAVDTGFIFLFMLAGEGAVEGPPTVFLIPFFILHMTPVWIAILGPIYRFFSSSKVEYLLTNKRIYIKSGLIGADIRSLELYEVQNLSVDVGLLEKMRGAGTILLTANAHNSSRNSSSPWKNKLLHISDPYEVYKLIQRVSLDVTTDYQFPNAYRPEENRGYTTRYNPQNDPRY